MANDQANDQATFIAYTSEVDPQDYLVGVNILLIVFIMVSVGVQSDPLKNQRQHSS